MSAKLPPITATTIHNNYNNNNNNNNNVIKLVYNFLILLLLANQLINFACLATPTPEILNSGSAKSNQLSIKNENDQLLKSFNKQSSSAQGFPSTTSTADSIMILTETISMTTQPPINVNINNKQAGNTVEKLKRGLANFLNKNNPAAYFVPAPQQVYAIKAISLSSSGSSSSSPSQATSSSSSSSSAEPAALVNGDPSADTIIKGPNRLAHSRPIGGPLRWGRRK